MNKKVLFLEDDVDLLRTYEDVVSGLFQQEAAPFSSFRQLQTQPDQALACHIAFLDINLGPEEHSGIDACHWLRKIGFKGKVVFLTGHALSHPWVIEACQSNLAEVYQKPLDLNVMHQLVAQGQE
jgi:DNA-binding NtrC family response regulator